MTHEASQNSTAEFGSKPQDLTAFNSAIGSIMEHNGQFSLGSMMSRMLLDHFDAAVRTQELVDGGLPMDEAEATIAWVDSDKVPLNEEQQMAKAIVGITNATALDGAGLGLSPVRKTAFIASNKGSFDIGEVRIQLVDGAKFSGFLGAISPKKVDETLRGNVTKVVDNLVTETRQSITKGEDEQLIAESIAYSDGILQGLTNIGMGKTETAQRLSMLSEHVRQGDAKEFIIADNLQLFANLDEQKYGPSEWQMDASGDVLSGKWQEVIDVLTTSKENPKAKVLFEQLIKAAHNNLDYAKKDWAKRQLKDGYGGEGEYGSEFDGIFKTVDQQLLALAPEYKHEPQKESKKHTKDATSRTRAVSRFIFKRH